MRLPYELIHQIIDISLSCHFEEAVAGPVPAHKKYFLWILCWAQVNHSASFYTLGVVNRHLHLVKGKLDVVRMVDRQARVPRRISRGLTTEDKRVRQAGLFGAFVTLSNKEVS